MQFFCTAPRIFSTNEKSGYLKLKKIGGQQDLSARKVVREKDALPNISPLDVVSYILNIKNILFRN